MFANTGQSLRQNVAESRRIFLGFVVGVRRNVKCAAVTTITVLCCRQIHNPIQTHYVIFIMIGAFI